MCSCKSSEQFPVCSELGTHQCLLSKISMHYEKQPRMPMTEHLCGTNLPTFAMCKMKGVVKFKYFLVHWEIPITLLHIYINICIGKEIRFWKQEKLMTGILYSFTFVTLTFLNVWLNRRQLVSSACFCIRSAAICWITWRKSGPHWDFYVGWKAKRFLIVFSDNCRIFYTVD